MAAIQGAHPERKPSVSPLLRGACRVAHRRAECRRETVEYARPTLLGTAGVIRQHALMGQGERASGPVGHDADAHACALRREFRHGEGKGEPARPIDLEIFADMLDVLAVAPVDEGELAADARVDLDAHHPPGRGREEKFAGDLGIEPGVEDALRRGVEAPDDTYGDRGRGAHWIVTDPPISPRPATREATSDPPRTPPSGGRDGAGLS